MAVAPDELLLDEEELLDDELDDEELLDDELLADPPAPPLPDEDEQLADPPAPPLPEEDELLADPPAPPPLDVVLLDEPLLDVLDVELLDEPPPPDEIDEEAPLPPVPMGLTDSFESQAIHASGSRVSAAKAKEARERSTIFALHRPDRVSHAR